MPLRISRLLWMGGRPTLSPQGRAVSGVPNRGRSGQCRTVADTSFVFFSIRHTTVSNALSRRFAYSAVPHSRTVRHHRTGEYSLPEPLREKTSQRNRLSRDQI